MLKGYRELFCDSSKHSLYAYFKIRHSVFLHEEVNDIYGDKHRVQGDKIGSEENSKKRWTTTEIQSLIETSF